MYNIYFPKYYILLGTLKIWFILIVYKSPNVHRILLKHLLHIHFLKSKISYNDYLF
jgi:hypothetical protein